MALKDTINQMKKLMNCINYDISKAEKGNKAASQRVRTCSIQFAKWAKLYRQESVAFERKGFKTSKTSSKKSYKTQPKRKSTKKTSSLPKTRKTASRKTSTKRAAPKKTASRRTTRRTTSSSRSRSTRRSVR